MDSVPVEQHWRSLQEAARAVLSVGDRGGARAFLRAAKELHAAALVLLFALAAPLAARLAKAPPSPAPRAVTAGRRLSPPSPPSPPSPRSARAVADPGAWRNPPVTEHRWAPAPSPPPLRRRADTRLRGHSFCPQAATAKALALLHAVIALCAAPQRHAEQLAARLAARPGVLTAAEVKAHALTRWRQAERNRAVGRLIWQEWRARRGRRRADSS